MNKTLSQNQIDNMKWSHAYRRLRVQEAFQHTLEIHLHHCTGGTVSQRTNRLNEWKGKQTNGAFFLGESENGFVISDHSDHGASKEPTNPLWTRIRRFLWCIMIGMIWDHKIRFWILPKKRTQIQVNRLLKYYLAVRGLNNVCTYNKQHKNKIPEE